MADHAHSTARTHRAIITAALATADETPPEPAPDPINALAVWWLDRWTHNGGSIYPDPINGGWTIGHTEYGYGPVAEDDERQLTASDWYQQQDEPTRTATLDRHMRWHGTFHTGGMRTLADMLTANAGLKEAVKLIVAHDPARGIGRLPVEAR